MKYEVKSCMLQFNLYEMLYNLPYTDYVTCTSFAFKKEIEKHISVT